MLPSLRQAPMINVGTIPYPFAETRKYATNAATVIVAPCEKFENFNTLNINANPVAINAYTAPVAKPLIST